MGRMVEVKLRGLKETVAALTQAVHTAPSTGSPSLPRTPRGPPRNQGHVDQDDQDDDADDEDEDDGYESPAKRKAREVSPLLNRYNVSHTF
jgi:hypothetical protein